MFSHPLKRAMLSAAFVLTVLVSTGSTIRCTLCHSCAAGHGTGMDTCDGQTCFVRKVKVTSSNASVVDRGCFIIQHGSFDTINRLCSGDTLLHGDFLTVYACCNNTEFCNTNLTVHFRLNRTPSPTTALSPAATVPVGRVLLIVVSPCLFILIILLVVVLVTSCVLLKYRKQDGHRDEQTRTSPPPLLPERDNLAYMYEKSTPV